MKKLFFVIALMLTSVCASAFEFDGIDLNQPYSKVARQISEKGYTFNNELNCLEGNCHGTNIYLSINYVDVSKRGMLGQLIVQIPFGNRADQFDEVSTIFNVIYHQVQGEKGTLTYEVDDDGTQLVLGQKDGYIVLTYNTPYYSARKNNKN